MEQRLSLQVSKPAASVKGRGFPWSYEVGKWAFAKIQVSLSSFFPLCPAWERRTILTRLHLLVIGEKKKHKTLKVDVWRTIQDPSSLLWPLIGSNMWWAVYLCKLKSTRRPWSFKGKSAYFWGLIILNRVCARTK